jgi:large subunit ribosomal protein L14e
LKELIEVGRVVCSTAGRDKGRHMIVVFVDGDYVGLADGCLRKVGCPKRKKRRHVRILPHIAQDLVSKLCGGTALDSDIRGALSEMGFNRKEEG